MGKRARTQGCEALLDGPSTVAECFNWPATLLLQVRARPRMMERLVARLEDGFLFDTDYSGIDSPKEVCSLCDQAVTDSLGRPWQHGDQRFNFVRSDDISPCVQRFLLEVSLAQENGRTCVFPSLEARLPDTAFF